MSNVAALEDVYCCCGIFSLDYALYLMSIHAFIHGSFGVFLVTTTIYKGKYNIAVNFLTSVGSGAFIPVGLFIFWVALNQSSKGAKVCGYIVAIVSAFCFIGAALYFAFYMRFQANSQIDVGLLWFDQGEWIDNSNAPFTFWHLSAFCFVVVTPIWWYNVFILRRYSKTLQKRNSAQIISGMQSEKAMKLSKSITRVGRNSTDF